MSTVGEGKAKRYVSFRASKHELEAIHLEKLGHKSLKRLAIISRTAKYEDAVVYFSQAADRYKADQKWRKAGECYARAADAEQSMENLLPAATFFIDAGDSFFNVDPLDAVKFYESAISLYAKVGRFASAAKVERRIAEIHEEDDAFEQAAGAYQLAADFYAGEHMYTQAIFCLARAGDYNAEAGRYDEAVDKYEVAGAMCQDDNMQKFNSPGLLLSCVMCWLCSGDVEAALEQFEESMARDFYFAGSRHAKFAADLIEATADFNIHSFMDHVWNFDNVQPFRPLQLNLLERLSQLVLAGPPRDPDAVDSDDSLSTHSSDLYSDDSDYTTDSDYSGSAASGSASGTRSRTGTGTATATGTARPTTAGGTSSVGGRSSKPGTKATSSVGTGRS